MVARGYSAFERLAPNMLVIMQPTSTQPPWLVRSGVTRLARSWSPRRRHHVESDLVEVAIGRDHGLQPQLPHDRDARAVRERKVLIPILEEEVPRPFKTIVLDAFPPQPSASVDLPPPCMRGCQPQAKSNQRQRLIDDEVSRDQDATGLERRVTGGGAGHMCRISTVRARHPTACIDEHGVHLRYKTAS